MNTLALPTRLAPADSPTDIGLLWQEAIHQYEQTTNVKITSLEPANNVDEVLRQTQKTASRFRIHRHDNSKLDKLRTLIGKSLDTVEAIGNLVSSAASIAFAPSTVIFAAVSHLLKTAKSVSSDYDILTEFFKDLDQHLSQLKILEGSIPPIPELRAALVRVLTSVLVLCGVAVKYTKQNRFFKGMKSLVKGEDSELRIAYDEFHRSIENENGAVRNATLVEVQQNLTISTRTESKTEVIVTHTERMNQYIEDQQDREAHIASTSERDDILKSLSSVNFHNKHIDILAKHQPNTGQWLLKSDKFQQWFRSHTCNTLGCTGIAGAGKTVLTSVAVDYLQQSVCGSDIAIVYLYCDYKDPKTRNEVELILSIAQQLAGQMDAVTPELKAFCEKKKDNRRGITNEDRLSVVESLVACFSRVYVCVDAIDECPEDNRNGFLWFLKKMQSLLYIVMTSRPHVDLKSYFPNMSQLEIVAPESDITEYLTSKIERDASLARLLARDPQLRGDILGGISKKAEGMFLLAHLQIASLSKQSPRAIRKSLEVLPTGIYATYEDAIQRIKEQSPDGAEFGMKALSYVFFATRPLEIDELLHALAVEPGDNDIEDGALSEAEILLNLCAGLIMIDEGSERVRLVHYTLQEYLESVQPDIFPQGEIEFARVCLTYLLFDPFRTGPCYAIFAYHQRWMNYPFIKYASTAWGKHIRNCSEPSELLDLIMEYLNMPDNVTAAVQLEYTLDETGDDWYDKFPKQLHPLHVAARWGLDSVLAILSKETADINSVVEVEYGYTPLFLAAENGHESTVRLLLDKGADTEARESLRGQTPLSRAVGAEYSVVVQILLERGANVDARDNLYDSTPLILAAFHGLEDIVGLLLDHGADTEARDSQSKYTALLFAAEKGHEPIVKRLLENNADINAADSVHKWSALNRAVVNGHAGVMKLLLEQGADIEWRDGDFERTALCEAAVENFVQGGALLMLHGADIEASDKEGSTPLALAASARGAEMVKLLLLNNANIETINDLGWRPLLSAASLGDEEVVEILLDHGAILEHANNSEDTALILAADKNYPGIVRLLLEHHADIEHGNKFGSAALSMAAARGHERVAALLLASGANIEQKNQYAWTPLINAARYGNTGMIEFLLNHGANPEHQADFSRTAFLIAVRYNHLEAVSLLIRRHPHLVSQLYPNDATALILAGEMGYDHMTELLLNTPIPIDSKDKNERTALHWAAVGGHVEVVKLLIDRKAGLELKDVDDSTPLILAILNDHEAVFKLLVETEQLSLDELDSYGRTPLFLAATHGYEHFVTQLISRGCQIAVTDFYSSTLLHVAVRSGLESLVCILLGSETFELDSEDCLGRTPRWWSRRCGHSAIETLLVDHAISQGIELRDSGEVPRISTADASLKSRPWCDVCTLVIDYDGRYCGCPEGCFQGRLAICSDCYELGARCMDSSHEVDWKVAPRPTES